MAEEERQISVDVIDAILASNRQRVILGMVENGQLDPEAGIDLYEHTTDSEVVAKDRAAAKKGFFGPDSPSGVLGTLWFKLARRD